MVALHTRFSGPTDTRGSRIVCHRMDWSPRHRERVIADPDDTFSDERSHFPAVKKLCARHDWHGKLVAGGSDNGYVWVFVPTNTPSTSETDYPLVYEV